MSLGTRDELLLIDCRVAFEVLFYVFRRQRFLRLGFSSGLVFGEGIRCYVVQVSRSVVEAYS